MLHDLANHKAAYVVSLQEGEILDSGEIATFGLPVPHEPEKNSY